LIKAPKADCLNVIFSNFVFVETQLFCV